MNMTLRQDQDMASGEGMTAFDMLGRGLKFLALLAVAAVIGWGLSFLYQKYDVPVAVIGVDGELKHVAAHEVETIVADNLGGGFLSLDLDGICAALEEHPWVAAASARRKWPDQVVITLEEETPIARWGNTRFLNNKGSILRIGGIGLPQSLPLLYGPRGQERRVMQQYRNFSQVLQATGLDIEEIRLAPRGNWEVTFKPGLELMVGKEPVAEKLQRFMLVWDKTLRDQMDTISQVDIRYGNGVAVTWKTPVDTAPGQKTKN